MTPPRIAFLDVDGTILDHGRTIAPSTVTAIREARERGALVYLSTGRSAGDIHPAVREIGFDGAITNGGAYAVAGDVSVVAEPMPLDAVDRLEAFFQGHGIHYFLQTGEGVYADAAVQRAVEAMLASIRPHGPVDPQTAPQRPPRFRELAEIDREQVAKAVFLSDAPDAVDRARAELGDRFHVIPGSIPLPGGSNGEIGLKGVTKGSAITAVLAHLGIDAADAIGIGDSWNDVEMFEVCGTGIAMGNADPELKAIADEVTTAVLDDGVHNAFARHGLI
ncbi:Cof-type HAD-IIB family hydrolase [Microbacterium sp. SORGH_AS_0888]|uniref:Cof-type HAD-IIB family hydrolase n=1 Tax=Microbacterium sp. SORGH_AS_0888 TaxID=3041791 RepID=UPI00277E2644|nr:Cof-type HAD-IIB family hydrolase [Microbacterium sp. SORGH_AS_0888]MDQ1129521.1 Cof subfamily protein (haloacid dehalogenase superfamily) [Microbacterium sp. SORGH_AS_0888]